MEAAESMESLDYTFPLNLYKKRIAFPLKCWQNISISDIWIPANLLSTKKKASNSQKLKNSVYHTLEKEGAKRCIESFSVYHDSEEEQEEIFESDSDEELFSSKNHSCEENINFTSLAENKSEADVSSYNSSISGKNITDHKLYDNINSSKIKHLESKESLSNNDLSNRTKTASFNGYEIEKNNSTETTSIHTVNEVQNITDSQISLNELLDDTPDINLNQFPFECIKKDAVKLKDKLDKKTELNMKRMNKKERQLKKKASKKITLEELPQYEIYEDDCANPFYQSIMRKKILASYSAEERNNIEFPKLVVEEAKFLKPETQVFVKHDKTQNEKNADIGLQSVIDIIAKTTTSKEENKVESEEPEVIMPETDEVKTELGKMIIENIPFDVAEEDIYCILQGYGQIKNFTLKPDGKFLKAFVEMDLICKIDWIVDCLNGTDPFGASTETLKCYNVTDS